MAVQSSSAVTVAAIGFVDAGLLSLGQALLVFFGANVGTAKTRWLEALVGMKFKIDAFVLPLIEVGMLLRCTGDGNRHGALGMALAGFGVLYALVSLDFGVEWQSAALAALGVLLISLTNLAVSFFLALWFGLKARNVDVRQRLRLIRALFWRIVTSTGGFLLPPREVSEKSDSI